MKYCFLVLSALVLFSCNDSDEASSDKITALQFANQKWELVRMTGSVENSESTGDEMDWQEYYLFGFDDTFEKVRDVAGVVSRAEGTFAVTERNNDSVTYLELTFKNGKELIGTCEPSKKEVLHYKSTTEIASLWSACDGPGLDYKLVKD